jgi:hypothetical protein
LKFVSVKSVDEIGIVDYRHPRWQGISRRRRRSQDGCGNVKNLYDKMMIVMLTDAGMLHSQNISRAGNYPAQYLYNLVEAYIENVCEDDDSDVLYMKNAKFSLIKTRIPWLIQQICGEKVEIFGRKKDMIAVPRRIILNLQDEISVTSDVMCIWLQSGLRLSRLTSAAISRSDSIMFQVEPNVFELRWGNMTKITAAIKAAVHGRITRCDNRIVLTDTQLVLLKMQTPA